MTGTLFLHRDAWRYSVRTGAGFRHYDVGRVTGLPTRAAAEQRLGELADRGEVPA